MAVARLSPHASFDGRAAAQRLPDEVLGTCNVPKKHAAIVFALCWMLGRAVFFGGHSCGYLTESHRDCDNPRNESRCKGEYQCSKVSTIRSRRKESRHSTHRRPGI